MPVNTPLPAVCRTARALREARGWTLQEAAAIAAERGEEVSYQAIWMLEQGRRPNPSMSTLRGLARIYDVTIDALIAEDEPTPPALLELVDAGLVDDLTYEELIRLRSARGLLGRAPDRDDYYDLVRLIRRTR